MLQQVNLYKQLSVKSRFLLSWRAVLTSYAMFLFILIFIYGVEFRHKVQILAQYTVLNNQVMVLQNRLTALKQQYPESNEVALNAANESLQYKLSRKIKILSLLSSNKDFSNYLTGLANLDVYNIWLNEIVFNNVGQKIILKGYALQSELVDKMVVQLNLQPAFSALKFEIQNITENPLPPSFEISARQEILL